MDKKLQKYIDELEAKIQILEVENEFFSYKTQENQLLTKVFEELNFKQYHTKIYSNILEHIAILLDIEYVGIFKIKKSKLKHLNSYLLTENANIAPEIEIPAYFYSQIIQNKSCLLKNSFSFLSDSTDFHPKELLIIPVSKNFSKECLIAAQSEVLESLEKHITLFKKITQIIALKLERFYYENELIALNLNLEQKVVNRTKELQQINARLEEEIQERKKIENNLIQQNKEYLTLNEEYKTINNELFVTKNKIEESEARFKKLSNLTFEGIVIHRNKIAVDTNLSFHRMFGYSREEIIGKDIVELLVDKKDHSLIEKKIRERNTLPYEVLGIKKDGTKFQIEIQVRIFDSEENTRVAAVRNVSFRKKIEQELQKQHTKLKKILDTIDVGIYLVNGDFTIQYVNPIMEKLFGPNLVGKKCYQAIFNFDHKCNFCKPNTVNKEKKYTSIEIQHKHLTLKLSTIILNSNEIMTIFQDITKLKDAENDLRTQNEELRIAKEKAEESDQLKTEFFQNISHEVRTPLNGIIGFTEFLKRPNLPEERRDYFIEIIQQSGNQLLNIIENLIELSRLETKQIKTSLEKFNLNKLLNELFAIYKISTQNKGIEIKLNTAFLYQDANIISDHSKLHKIITNLIDNAIKFTTQGFIEFGYNVIKRQKPIIQIYVKDTGIGIRKNKLNTIFERFSQEEKELSQKKGGLGLGLSIAKKNTELLGGKISVESEKGKGSIFKLEIPLLRTNK